MASAALTPSLQSPLPEDLPKLLHSLKTPWQISPRLFERMTKQYEIETVKGKPFSAVQVTNQDPEFYFVQRYFQHQKPPHIGIKNILCIHNPDQSKMFEGSLMGMEAAAKAFPPAWGKEEPKAHRAQTMERWKKSVAPFSPFELPRAKRTDKFFDCKIIPLWHGSKHVDSICKIGFTFFGKHHFFDKTATAGAQASTDIGYFGSGIYFTNSAQYASMYNSGTLVLSWVSMREPYPVVNDVSIPQKGSDMKKLQGKGAYQNYNAHYIPVTSIDPKEPENMVYHPCHQTEQPAWDEYVVFEKSQALPCFVVELGVDLPTPVSLSIGNSSEKTVGIFIVKLEQLLEHPSLKGDQELVEMITKKLDCLLDLDSESPIPAGELGFYNRIIRLIDPKGKVNPTYLNLIKQPHVSAAIVSSKPNIKEEPPSLAKVVKKDEPASPLSSAGSGGMNQKMGYVYPSVSALASPSAVSSATGAIQAVSKPPLTPKLVQNPTIAFGAEQWKKYFGDVGQEPPLPANIQEILNSPCPFIQGKKKEETHLLVLIPATLNGQPMTLKRLGALMKARDSKLGEGGYGYFNDDGIHIDTPFENSHWVLLTKDVIEGSREKSYSDQQALVARYPGYQVPRLSEATSSIYMHYVVTGQRLYKIDTYPTTCTRCQEKYDADYQMSVGAFNSSGLFVYNRYGDGNVGVGVAGLWKF